MVSWVLSIGHLCGIQLSDTYELLNTPSQSSQLDLMGEMTCFMHSLPPCVLQALFDYMFHHENHIMMASYHFLSVRMGGA